jgi:hypothetical protein
MGKCFNWILRRVLPLELRDSQCGFKLFRAAPARRLFDAARIDGFAFDAEISSSPRDSAIGWRRFPFRGSTRFRAASTLCGTASRCCGTSFGSASSIAAAFTRRAPLGSVPAPGRNETTTVLDVSEGRPETLDDTENVTLERLVTSEACRRNQIGVGGFSVAQIGRKK